MKFTSVREAAAFYVSIGLRPIPMYGVGMDGACRCGGLACNAGKHELAETDGQWKDGREFGPDDFTEKNNIAIALGPYTDEHWLVCLDIDGHPDASPFFPDLPRTLTQRSPRGGHLFYVVPPYAPLGNWVDCFLTKYTEGYALDLRYARGKVNVAPSRTAFGGYEWGEWREPAELPGGVIEQILDRRRERGLEVLDSWDRGGKRA